MGVDTYERLDEHEISRVRAYRRQLWTERAQRDPDGARQQLLDSLRTHADAWPDELTMPTITSITMSGTKVGNLNPTQRYALISLIEAAA